MSGKIISPEPGSKNNVNDLYRLLVESVKDYAIFMLDTTGRVSTWNEGAFRIKQYSAEEIIGKHFSVFYTGKDLAADKPGMELREAVRLGRFEDEDWRVRKDGTRFWANVVITAVYDYKGNHIGFSKVTRDLTERKMAEQEVADSAEKFKILAESVPQMIWTADPQGKLNFMNQRWKNFSGLEIEDLKGEKWQKIIHPKDLSSIKKAWNTAFKKGTELNIEMRLVDSKGRYNWFLSRALPVRDKKGEVILWVGSHTDIDGQKAASEEIIKINEKLEKTIKQREFSLKALQKEVKRSEKIEAELVEKNRQLEISNNDLEQFAYVASHDLREPLRMIGSFTNLLLLKYNNTDDLEVKEFSGFIAEGVQRMQVLINDLLEYSRVGRTEIAFQKVDVTEMLEDAKNALSTEIEETGAKISAPKLPVIEGVPSLISNLFQNLLGNAIKFRKPGTKPVIKIDFTSTEEFWKFCVADNGLGISKEYQERIFIIFQRLHTREKYEGTGIGLSICKKIVEFHGGKIWVESENGDGSTFHFTIAKNHTKQELAN